MGHVAGYCPEGSGRLPGRRADFQAYTKPDPCQRPHARVQGHGVRACGPGGREKESVVRVPCDRCAERQKHKKRIIRARRREEYGHEGRYGGRLHRHGRSGRASRPDGAPETPHKPCSLKDRLCACVRDPRLFMKALLSLFLYTSSALAVGSGALATVTTAVGIPACPPLAVVIVLCGAGLLGALAGLDSVLEGRPLLPESKGHWLDLLGQTYFLRQLRY